MSDFILVGTQNKFCFTHPTSGSQSDFGNEIGAIKIKNSSDMYMTGAERGAHTIVYDEKGRISDIYGSFSSENLEVVHFIYDSDDSDEVINADSGACTAVGQCTCYYSYVDTGNGCLFLPNS